MSHLRSLLELSWSVSCLLLFGALVFSFVLSSHFFSNSECSSACIPLIRYTRFVVLNVFVVLPPCKIDWPHALQIANFVSSTTNRWPLHWYSQPPTSQKSKLMTKLTTCAVRNLVWCLLLRLHQYWDRLIGQHPLVSVSDVFVTGVADNQLCMHKTDHCHMLIILSEYLSNSNFLP